MLDKIFGLGATIRVLEEIKEDLIEESSTSSYEESSSSEDSE